MKKLIVSTLCVGMLSLPATAKIFDDVKQGFMVGLGIGVSGISTEIDYTKGLDYDENAAAMVTSFKIGYAFNEQLSVYYTNQVDWYTFNESSTTVGLTGIGVDYYIASTSGLYFTGMLGFGSISDIHSNVFSSGSGFGIGVGHDLLPHMSVDISYMNINIDETNVEVDTDSLRLKFNYTWY